MTDTDLLLGICRGTVDPDARALRHYPGHGGTRVLCAATRLGEVIIKIHRNPLRHEQEIHAYRHWLPALDGRCPRLLAVCDEPPAVVVSTVAGRPLADLKLPAGEERDAHRQAGGLLRGLHNAGPQRAKPDMTAWLVDRSDYWLYRAEPILPLRERTEIRAHMKALAAINPIPAVPCHLDYTPRNLLVAAEGAVAVIDFEHCRYDLAARDLVRLSRRVWSCRPDLEEAFLTSYGPLSDLDREIIEHCVYLDALTSAVRGHGSQ